MQKLVSVIIPTFNRAEMVVKAIQSVKAQSYPNIQIIVIDDGSADNTAEIISQFEDVEYYYQANKGQAAARNLGLKHAKGEYIASLDSDDVWDKNFLKVAVAALEGYQADFVFLNFTEIVETEERASGWERSEKWRKYSKNSNGEWSFLTAKEVRRLFLETCPAPSSSLLIRRDSFVETWNEEMKIADDWCLVLDMVLTKSCRAAFTLSPYWTKNVHSSNIYHGREELEIIRDLGLHDEPLIARRFQEQLSIKEKAILKKRLAGHYFNFGRLNLKYNGFALKHLQSITTAFKLAPLGSVLYIMQLSYQYLESRINIIQEKFKQS